MNIDNKEPNLADEIKFIIQDVINTNNFSRLNSDISRTVNSALGEVESMFGIHKEPRERNVLWEPLAKEEKPKEEPEKYAKSKYQFNGRKSNTQTYDMTISKSPAGSVSGVVLTIFGILGLGLAGIFSIGYGASLAFAGAALSGIIAAIPLFGISGVLLICGINLRKRTQRFRRYVAKLANRKYCDLKELAEATGKSNKFVAADLKKMINLGMFPEAHLDEKQTCFMLDHATYTQYKETEKWVKEQKEEAEKQKKEAAKNAENIKNEDETAKALRNTIEEGKRYIVEIRSANDAIPGEEVSQKLERLEAVTTKIFSHIEKHPEQIPQLRKFMNYYLPTTLKLMNAYKELDNQPISGDNISSSKNEIQKTLDTINLAFENLLDDLFYDAAMDISSDISVLETMLAQEGLTEKDFVKK